MAAVSGTFNLIHPDRATTADAAGKPGGAGRRPARRWGPASSRLCTGTCDPVDMWKAHPDNDSPEAWRQLVESLRDGADTDGPPAE